ncbi:WXG100 family type VII secretion target [Kitasatospora sp. A2-31]|uniref:WXG100 family type VII secretion target n=1 Tax=Kitasatospora sp. A2-31 TaxID=2916414 RepID=UPI001EEA5C85|nr:hypothetical protein [Kitasatospora sp. A2-31]MCG6496318.1 hypothetical protein [Kitasatospora sp. A2-31]
MNAMDYTKFNNYSHAELRKMAQALNPGEVMAASDPWRRASDTLKAIRATLTRTSTETALTWEGATSDAFHSRMLHLANTINNAASYANDAANTLKSLSEAIAKAKRDMPEEPSGWDQFTDGVGDTVSALFGGDDEDTRTAIAQQKKVEAAAVMQTLAMHYRVAAPILKPPPPPPPPPPLNKQRGDGYQEVSSGDDPSAAAASAVMAGASYSGVVATPPARSVPAPRPQKAAGQPATNQKAAVPAAPVDSGIKGGSAQVPRRLPSAANFGPGTGIDAATVSNPPNTTTTPSVAAGTGPNHGMPSGHTSGPNSGGYPAVSRAKVAEPNSGAVNSGRSVGQGGDPLNRANGPAQAAARGTKAFGAGEVMEGGFGAGGRAAGGSRPTGGRQSGWSAGAVGEGSRSGGAPAKQAFTEGGSGIGARGRGRGESSVGATSPVGPGMPVGDAQRRRQDKEKGSKRPDYLVEDEETWAPDKPVNPNVVE